MTDEGRGTGDTFRGSPLLVPPTTDPQHELFAILNAQGQPTGDVKPRGAVHRDGDWHGALHIWVYGVSAAMPEGFVLFQRRSRTKDTWPGALDVAVGGHIRAGETLAATAREAEEEIGLRVELADLTRIGRRYVAGGRDGVIDREVQDVFAVRHDAPLGDYRLHPDEVDALVAIALPDALALFSGEREPVPARERPRDASVSRAIVVTRAEVAGSDSDHRYARRCSVLLGALLRGEPVVPFELREG